MAKKKESNGNALPSYLQEVVDKAETNRSPAEDAEDKTACPRIFELLSPRVVYLPSKSGEGEPKRAVRQPMMMVFWDSANGGWAVQITDKTLGAKVMASVPHLASLIGDFEAILASGKAGYKPIE